MKAESIPDLLQIRAALRTELVLLSRLAYDSKASRGYPERYMSVWREALTVTKHQLQTGSVRVAAYYENIVGFTTVVLDAVPPEAELQLDKALILEHCFIRPDFIGRGIGRLLMEDVRGQHVLSEDCPLYIEADPEAEGFYRRLGAVRVGRVPTLIPGRWLPVLLWY
ncbi:MAG: GNAT family N-acetyltransferase [Leptospiraceae bacterium]|nr:GNAT family N-acetyltransferase [Leptospiraceae bacterium]MCB1316816.1 GNAT family N-acetyltransferase [Leptospiraceae bacterium]MCB1321727.1 GNAT family N-acetyltransferase [Leptospiraceae bacterium]